MRFINEENFTTWLKETVRDGVVCDFSSWIEDVEREVYNDYKSVEISGQFTKTGSPATYNFEVEHHYFLNGKEVEPRYNGYDYLDGFDFMETVVIF